MDISRPDISRRKRRRRILISIAGAVLLGLITLGLSQLKPALPSVDGAAFTGTVKRGEMLCEVRGNGTLVPEEIRWMTATSPGRVEKILLLPGVTVEPDTVLVELSNPELEQETFEAESQWHAAEAQLERLKVQLDSERLTQQSLIASLKSDMAQASIEAEADEDLLKDGLVPALAAKRTRSRANELKDRHTLEQERLTISKKSTLAQLRVQDAEVERLRKQWELRKRQMEALKVRAGIPGVLQRLGDERPLQVGQQVLAGATIARIANPAKLKAEIRVAETQARDIQFDQRAVIDTRNGTVPGHVVRIDPAAVNGTVTIDIALDAPPPRGARPDLSVDGTITLEHLENVLYVGRPVNGQADSLLGLFKVVDGGRRAVRVQVKLGRTSVSNVEVKEGLEEGDQIILSDMSQYDGHEQVRLK
ncbi:MAG: HlyD family efflux transporter periplasmic adaptor subunit [Verrucomicrobiales bacterium]|nr:HlyD family efflux transporter periplasmic adaptor subunit [Verrucomicrobiales bacterium]